MVKALTSFLAALLLTASAHGQIPRDPTQPPAGYKAATDADSAESDAGEVAVYLLQSIVRRHGAKPVAVINGQMLQLGGKIDDRTLLRIGESEVVLKGPGGNETLMMAPAVEKQPVRPAVSRRLREGK